MRAVLVLGVTASVVANVLHAAANPISQAIAGWPPIALLLTVELISRIPLHSRALAAVRLIATAAIAGIAAWVSYWHMVGVAARYGESPSSAHLLPLSVDGLIVVASLSLVELSARRIPSGSSATGEHKPVEHSAPPGPRNAGAEHSTAPPDAMVAPRPMTTAPRQTAAAQVRPDSHGATGRRSRPADAVGEATPLRHSSVSAVQQVSAGSESADGAEPARAAAVRLREQHPDMGPEEISRRVGKSVRQVHRYLAGG